MYIYFEFIDIQDNISATGTTNYEPDKLAGAAMLPENAGGQGFNAGQAP
jgi:hypothetical protein